jgi:hypothetical protein
MRRSTFLWLFLAAFCGTFLFHTSQKVIDDRKKLSALEGNIAQEKESIRVLGVEWSYLNQPARLEKLSKENFGMEPLKANQFVKVEDISPRPAPDTAVTAPAIIEKSVAKEPKEIEKYKPAVAAAKPVIKIRKPAEAAYLQKPVLPKHIIPHATASNARSFGDVVKSLGVQ